MSGGGPSLCRAPLPCCTTAGRSGPQTRHSGHDVHPLPRLLPAQWPFERISGFGGERQGTGRRGAPLPDQGSSSAGGKEGARGQVTFLNTNFHFPWKFWTGLTSFFSS